VVVAESAGLNINTRTRWPLAAAAVSLLAASAVRAADFTAAYYDAGTSEIVVTMLYRGTNPDHQFTVQWGSCHPLGSGGNQFQISGDVQDSQWDDTATTTYTKTVRFPVANLNCHPATVTLHTAPRFTTSVQIP
jgi:hypothetical protein